MTLLLLIACTPGPVEAPIRATAPVHDLSAAFAAPHPSRTLSRTFLDARRGPPPPDAGDDPFAGLGAELFDGVLVQDRGEDLMEAMSAFPEEEVEARGAGVLSLSDLIGTGTSGDGLGLCEDPMADFMFQENGTTYETRLGLGSFFHLTEPLATLMAEFSTTCLDALVGGDVAGAIEAGACTEEEEVTFFEEGSDCRTCLEDGDPNACLSDARCVTEAPLRARADADGQWYEWAQGELLACAPDVPIKLYFASADLPGDGTLPGSWDQTAWRWSCLGVADTDGEASIDCVADADGYADLGDGVGDGTFPRVEYLREAGERDTPHEGRYGYSRRLHLDNGMTLEQMWITTGGFGSLSMPFLSDDDDGDGVIDDDEWGEGHGGMGFVPNQLRPDGTDPSNLDHLFARDWLASAVLKTATTLNGVFVVYNNHSECIEWVGPDEEGAYTCVAEGPMGNGWWDNTYSWWWDVRETQTVTVPMITLGSTGLPDPLVPGGFVVHLAGTDALADEDWDGSYWPNRLVPDHTVAEDVEDELDGPASLDADCYRFGKDPEQDIRVVLRTNQTRGFAPEE